MVSRLASGPSRHGFDSQHSWNFSDEKIVAEGNQQGCLAESGLWLEYFDPTHLVLASGKLVLQKNYDDLSTLVRNIYFETTFNERFGWTLK